MLLYWLHEDGGSEGESDDVMDTLVQVVSGHEVLLVSQLLLPSLEGDCEWLSKLELRVFRCFAAHSNLVAGLPSFQLSALVLAEMSYDEQTGVGGAVGGAGYSRLNGELYVSDFFAYFHVS